MQEDFAERKSGAFGDLCTAHSSHSYAIKRSKNGEDVLSYERDTLVSVGSREGWLSAQRDSVDVW